MATADQVKALVRSHAEGDDSQFYSVAMQVAARAARGGQNKVAQELRDLIDDAKQRASQPARQLRAVPVAQPRGELSDLLAVSYPGERLADLALSSDVAERLVRVITEQRQADRLRQHGLQPLRSLLLLGPPGTGKTMTAKALAGELHLPLFLIRLESLITKYMGETAAKLRLVFDAVESTRGIYLFDEVEALGGDRTTGNDVGEIRRVLNSFLQFLEADDPASLIVATTNHPQLLDRAMFRRFGAVIEFPMPTPALAREVIGQRLASLSLRGINWKPIDEVAVGLSHGELTLACDQAAKETILDGRKTVQTTSLVSALRERRHSSSN